MPTGGRALSYVYAEKAFVLSLARLDFRKRTRQ